MSGAGCAVFENKKLSELCSFKIGGAADYFIEIPTENALSFFLKTASEKQLRFFILGGGTNVLFSDKGFRGCVVKLTGNFGKIAIVGNKVFCGAAAFLPALVKKTALEDLSGLENCAGIPGTVGGAVLGNAGSAENWIGDSIESIEVYNRNGEKEIICKEKAGFEYRKSALGNFVISGVNFFLKKDTGNDILKAISDRIEKRAKTQPLSAPNAGCIFKNPLGLSAGKLIEDAGLKGRKKSGAKVSEIHANFIVNEGGATADNALDLIYTVRKTVKDKFNIDLELEI
ncbi:MAG: UDP-N-acetylmuramate dehydrogenase, partial [Endomicrobium sp.]|nr:UDP-N-acetylmuramate dehydrogenase [Endomicrobium sp.]